MIRNSLLVVFLMIALAGCDSQSGDEPEMKPWGFAATTTVNTDTRAAPTTGNAPNKNKYLAYEHFITIDLEENQLVATYQKLLSTCGSDEQNKCTVLASSINSGDYPSANIRLRINPEGVKSLTTLVAQTGSITNQTTRVEDLASPIIDSEKRISMLTAHRDRLLALEEKAGKDIDALIKISQELSTTQSNLEEITGQNQYLMQQVNMQIMNIQFEVKNKLSFWKPIDQALDSFSSQLAYGVANVIRTLARMLPWAIALVLFLFITRFVRNRKKR